MRLMQGTDKRRADVLRIWVNRFGTIMCLAVIIGFCYGIIYFSFSDNKDYVIIIVMLVMLIPFYMGLLDSTWSNEMYYADKSGLHLNNALKSKTIKWDQVQSWDVLPIFMTNRGKKRDYIVLFLSNKRPNFPVNLTYCSIHRKEMIVIRSTPERLSEITKILNDDMYLK